MQCIDPGVSMSPMLLLAQETRSAVARYLVFMVAREPGESDADYELRKRDHRHRRYRSSSEESSAAGPAAELRTGSGWFSRPGSDSGRRTAERKSPKEPRKARESQRAKPRRSEHSSSRNRIPSHLEVRRKDLSG